MESSSAIPCAGIYTRAPSKPQRKVSHEMKKHSKDGILLDEQAVAPMVVLWAVARSVAPQQGNRCAKRIGLLLVSGRRFAPAQLLSL